MAPKIAMALATCTLPETSTAPVIAAMMTPQVSLVGVAGFKFPLVVIMVTSADSGTFVVSMMTTNGNLNPATPTKLTWGVILAAITGAVLVSGSVQVAKAMAIFGAIPFTFIVVVQIVAFMRAIRQDEGKRPAGAQAPAGAAE